MLFLTAASSASAASLDVQEWLSRPGVKLVAVEFYATWCAPCMAAVPKWRALHEKYKAQGLRLVVVATQDPDGGCSNPGWNPDEVVCDDEGLVAARFGAKDRLPAAFLWSWQGKLLVKQGHVEQAEAAIEQWLTSAPRVQVEAQGGGGVSSAELEALVRARLQDEDKLTVIATDAERKQLDEIVRKSYQAGFDDKLQCQLGQDLSANSLLKVSVAKKRLYLSMLSAERKCLVASSVVAFDGARPSRSVAEGIAELQAKLRGRLEMPAAKAAPRAAGVGFGQGLAAVEPPPLAPALEAPPATSVRGLDVGLLKLLQQAKRTEKDQERTDEDRALAWERLASYAGPNPMKQDAEKRRDQWRARAVARTKRCEQLATVRSQQGADRAKLAELLSLDDDVFTPEQKRAARQELETTYAPYRAELETFARACPEMARAARPGPETKKPKEKVTLRPPWSQPRALTHPRARALLVTEIQGLERLAENTAKNSPERPVIIRRMAEGYRELAAAATRDRLAAEQRKDGTAAAQAAKVTEAAWKKAIEHYTGLTSDYPNLKDLDQVLWALAMSHGARRDLKNQRSVLYDLIKTRPKSPHIPAAYLEFGELFFVEAQQDPTKLDLARQAYLETMKYPPPDNEVYGYAAYKAGLTDLKRGDAVQALNLFKKAIDHSLQHPRASQSAALGEAAREELLDAYATAGRPEAAYKFLTPLAPGGDAVAYTVQLAERFHERGKHAEEAVVYRSLVAETRGPAACAQQARLTRALIEANAEKAGIAKEVRAALDLAAKSRGEACDTHATEAAVLAADAWKREALGDGAKRGTADKATITLALELYDRVLEAHSGEALSTMHFENLPPESWPTPYELKLARAELSHAAGKWRECRAGFEELAREYASVPLPATAAERAAECARR